MIKILVNSTIFIFCCLTASAQNDVLGRWATVDDATGETKSIVEVRETNGKVSGQVVKLFLDPAENPDPVCTQCAADDPRHGKKILGMEIFSGLVPDDDGYAGGTILDPESGRVYRCRIWRAGEKLMVRGYWGPFFRTQEWKKVP